jgi:outer membrane protein assembly factor BamD
VRSYDALGLPQLRDDAQRVLKTNFPNSDIPATRSKKSPWWKIW